MKYLWIAICFFIALGLSAYFYSTALTQSTYVALPTVACIDNTQPIKQNFSLIIAIYISNKKYSLDPTIGHDYGDCLHSIFTNDNSGKVYIKANDTIPLTLGQFFDVWKKTFSKQQIFSYQVTTSHQIKVLVNNIPVNTYRETVLKPNQAITIIYN